MSGFPRRLPSMIPHMVFETFSIMGNLAPRRSNRITKRYVTMVAKAAYALAAWIASPCLRVSLSARSNYCWILRYPVLTANRIMKFGVDNTNSYIITAVGILLSSSISIITYTIIFVRSLPRLCCPCCSLLLPNLFNASKVHDISLPKSDNCFDRMPANDFTEMSF